MSSQLATLRVATVSPPPHQLPDVRERIVGASLALVGERGESALTIRAIAARCGIAPSELYRHFPGKRALVAALSRQGEQNLGRWLDDPAWQATAFERGLEALCHRYLEFARRRPRLYRLMFCTESSRHDASGDPAFTGRARLLLSEPIDFPSTRPLQLWVAMHGMALAITRHVDTPGAAEPGRIDAHFIDDYIATIVHGIETVASLHRESGVDPLRSSHAKDC